MEGRMAGSTVPAHPPSHPTTQCVAIFASREECTTLQRTIDSVRAATGPRDIVDVLVNGNSGLVESLCRRLPLGDVDAVRVRVWWIALGDKAHAWNQYMHDLRTDGDATFFLDGYVSVRPDAFRLLAAAAAASPGALAATGVPTSGRSASRMRRDMLRDGGLHGNLFMLTSRAMQSIRRTGIRLPLGLYRTDSTIGAALAFGLDPARNQWDPKRFIVVQPKATWTTEPKHWWSYTQCIAQLKRIRRQAQGALENAAVQQLFAGQRRLPHELPATVEDLLLDWAEFCPDDVRRLTSRSPLRRAALGALQTRRHRSDASQPPALVFDSAESAAP